MPAFGHDVIKQVMDGVFHVHGIVKGDEGKVAFFIIGIVNQRVQPVENPRAVVPDISVIIKKFVVILQCRDELVGKQEKEDLEIVVKIFHVAYPFVHAAAFSGVKKDTLIFNLAFHIAVRDKHKLDGVMLVEPGNQARFHVFMGADYFVGKIVRRGKVIVHFPMFVIHKFRADRVRGVQMKIRV